MHLVLAGLGARLLARRLGLDALAAGAAGALWMASGPLLSVVDTWNQLAGAAWMPWSIAAGLGALAGRRRAALAWGVVSALQLLAGSPETVLMAWAAVGVLVCVTWWRAESDAKRFARAAAGAVVAAALTLGLSAAQWMPALDAAREAGRTRLPREARVHWSVHPVNLVQSVVPVPLHRLALTAPARDALYGAPDPFLPSIYLGGVTALLAVAALTRPTRASVGLAAVCGLSALLALGRYAGVFELLTAVAPPLQAFRYPAKALLLASLAASLLAALGLSERTDARWRWAPAIAGGLVALACAAATCALAVSGTGLGLFVTSPDLPRAATRLAIAAAIVGIAAVLARPGSRTLPAVLAGLALLDLAVAHHDLNPTAPVALYTHEPAAVAAARDGAGGRLQVVDYLEPGASRRFLGRDVPYLLTRAPVGWDLRAAQALALREALFPPSASIWGAQGSFERDVPGLEPAPLARLKEAWRAAGTSGDRLRLLQLGAVTRVAALHDGAGDGLRTLGRYPGYFVDPVLVFEASPSLPRAYVVGSARVQPDDQAALSTLLASDFDPAREIVLASGAGGAAETAFEGTSRIRERRGDRVVLETSASAPGWAVLVDAWDPGWSARVDGSPAALLRANLAFRAVPVPAGRHEVEMRFAPRRLAPALATSGVSLAALVLGAFLWRRPSGEGAAA